MAFVIMVGLLKRSVSLDQQTCRRWGGGNKTLAEKERKADSGQTDDGAVKVNSHIILSFVILPDVPARTTVTHNIPTASWILSSSLQVVHEWAWRVLPVGQELCNYSAQVVQREGLV